MADKKNYLEGANMKKRPGYSPVNRMPWLVGMILIFICMRSFVSVTRDENVACCCFDFSSVCF